jgi:hypothetical protein
VKVINQIVPRPSGSDGALDSTSYQISTRYDALNRAVEITYPTESTSSTGHRAALKLHHNRAGALEKVELEGVSYVSQIAYNAKGQRILIAYGNGLMTRYAYDPYTFRLTRLRTEHYLNSPLDHTWTGTGKLLQELTYSYDLVGTFMSIEDRTPG